MENLIHSRVDSNDSDETKQGHQGRNVVKVLILGGFFEPFSTFVTEKLENMILSLLFRAELTTVNRGLAPETGKKSIYRFQKFVTNFLH